MNASLYSSEPTDFANRAAKLLESNDSAHLFYAALEIRLGVEARMQAYAQASLDTSAALKKGWQIAQLAKGLEKAFKGVKDVVEMSISNSPQEQPFAVLYYTPVCSELQKLAQRLGDYLHYREIRVDRNESWWTQFRTIVERAQVLLSFACSGQMLGPPLWNPSTGEVHMNAQFNLSDPIVDKMQQLAHTRLEMAFNVSYIPVEHFYVRGER